MKKGILNNLWALLVNLLLAYMVYLIARTAYLLENYGFFAETINTTQLWNWYRGGLLFDTSAIIYTNALWIIMMLFPFWLKETTAFHRVCKWVFVVVNSLAFVLNLMDSVYFPYTLRRTTTSVFREFNNENNLGGVFLTELVSHWYFVLLAIVVIFGMWKLYRMPRLTYKDFMTARQRLAFTGVHVLILVIAVPLAIGGCRGGLQSGVRPITISNANQYVSRPAECAVVLNTPFSLLRTLGKNVFVIPSYYKDEVSLKKTFNPIHTPSDTLTANKKNVVILIVESFGREYIGALNKSLENGQYKGYTPNIDKLITQSTTFTYSYSNGHKSIDGMPSVLCSIPMFVEPFVLTPSSMNTYTSIAGLLSNWGYETAFFHGANRGSMGFLAFANKIGFQQYYGRQDYAADVRFGGDSDFDGNWGIWDEPFLQYYCTKMGEMKQPFMTAVFTVSSHHPFVVPDRYKNVYPEEGLEIHKCIRYTDMALGKFFESARKQSWFENTIFVLTCDHTNMSDHSEYKTDLGEFAVPIIIYDPSGSIEPGMRNTIAQQIDIMPTVLGILGYNKPYLSFGCDVLNTPSNETYAVSYLNGVYQYVKSGYVLQFDGIRTKGIYALTDRLMRRNLLGKVPQQTQMEQELKAIIQQYMTRMVNDQLMP